MKTNIDETADAYRLKQADAFLSAAGYEPSGDGVHWVPSTKADSKDPPKSVADIEEAKAVTQEQVDRWVLEVTPIIRRLEQVAENLHYAQFQAQFTPDDDCKKAAIFFDRLQAAPDALEQIQNDLLDAKGRAFFGMDVAQFAKVLQAADPGKS